MASIELSSQVIDLTAAVNVVSPGSPLTRLITRSAITIPPDATVADAAAAMEAAGVSALLVEGAGGVVTERDIARATAHGVPGDEFVDAVATHYPLVVPGSLSVVEACGVMLNEHFRHLVVAIDGDRVGIVSLRDLAAVLLQAADPHLWLASQSDPHRRSGLTDQPRAGVDTPRGIRYHCRMELPEDIVADVIRRLRRVEGQVRGLQQMLAEGRDCREVVTQLSAANKALEQAGFVIVAAGLTWCMEDPERSAAEGYELADVQKMFTKLA